VDLRGADLSGADLRHAVLCNADLRHAFLCNADLSDANLRGANVLAVKLSSGQREDFISALGCVVTE
jgi:uncharacterized protein YjbI with pentapeptide repeats